MKILTNDTVLVISGKDKGKKATVLRAFPKASKAVVDGVNVVTKHIKKAQGRPGQKVTFEKPVDASNLQVICPNCSKPTRIGYKVLADGKKTRICKKCGEGIARKAPATK